MSQRKHTVEEICERLELLKTAAPGSGINGTDFVREQLEHENAEVRTRAAECAWNWPDGETAEKLVELARKDPEKNVRVAAIKSLGWYMSFGEENMYEDYEEGDLPTGEWIEEEVTVKQYQEIRDCLLETYQDTKNRSLDERRYALEAISFVYREDVMEYTKEAYDSGQEKLVISALFGMGRSGLFQWKNQILEALTNENDEIRFEAIRAAGKCGVDEARSILREIAATTVERGEGEEAVMALAQFGHTESFLFFDQLESSTSFEVTADFANYAMNEWMLYNKIR